MKHFILWTQKERERGTREVLTCICIGQAINCISIHTGNTAYKLQKQVKGINFQPSKTIQSVLFVLRWHFDFDTKSTLVLACDFMMCVEQQPHAVVLLSFKVTSLAIVH